MIERITRLLSLHDYTLRFYLNTLFGLIGISFVLWITYTNWGPFREQLQFLDYLYLGAALLSGILCHLIMAYYFSLIVNNNKKPGKVQFKLGVKLFLISQPSKYIPGKIWQILHQRLLSKSFSLREVALANIQFMAGISFFILALSLCIISLLNSYWYALLLSTISFITVLIYFRFSLKLILPFISACFFLIGSGLIVQGLGVHLNFLQTANLTAIFGLSWILGTIAFIFPAGIGLREWLIVSVPTTILYDVDPQVLVVFAVFLRLWQISYELLCWGGVRIFTYFYSKE